VPISQHNVLNLDESHRRLGVSFCAIMTIGKLDENTRPVSRRRLMAIGATLTLTSGHPASELERSTGNVFEAWSAERRAIETALDDTLEEIDPDGRERLFDRAFALERLILTTPSVELSAMKAKAHLLLWLMEMERADGLPAMRHIHAYLHQST
jgi:hypothetical protein